MALVDDRELLRLAAPPAEPMYRVLDRARWMRPLLLFCAVIPVLYAAGCRTLTASDATLGLQALDWLARERDNLLSAH